MIIVLLVLFFCKLAFELQELNIMVEHIIIECVLQLYLPTSLVNDSEPVHVVREYHGF